LLGLLLFCSACSETTMLKAPDQRSAEAIQADRRHCEGEMYSQRMARGRSAPSWTIYDYCMKARGYTREEVRG
jgi:hypothetical protein